MKKLRPDQEAELAKGLAAEGRHERYLAERGVTVEEDRAAMRQFREDCIYMGEIQENMAEQYPDLWVAVYHKEVIATASTHTELLEKIAPLVRFPGSAAMGFIYSNPPIFIL